jgi:exosortase H (IPTLxxWG-CTERM-specific)
MSAKFMNPAIVRFLLTFAGSVLVLSILLQLPWIQENVQYPYTRLIAQWNGFFLNAFHIPVTVEGTVVREGNFAVEIRRGCDGLDVFILFFSALIAFPFPWKRMLLGLMYGTAIIFGLNLIRTVVLFLIGRKTDRATFEFFHLYVWQFAIILVVMVFWIYWIGRDKQVSAH